jgi:hypothetical protein
MNSFDIRRGISYYYRDFPENRQDSGRADPPFGIRSIPRLADKKGSTASISSPEDRAVGKALRRTEQVYQGRFLEANESAAGWRARAFWGWPEQFAQNDGSSGPGRMKPFGI